MTTSMKVTCGLYGVLLVGLDRCLAGAIALLIVLIVWVAIFGRRSEPAERLTDLVHGTRCGHGTSGSESPQEPVS